jgi:hypothetical protein
MPELRDRGKANKNNGICSTTLPESRYHSGPEDQLDRLRVTLSGVPMKEADWSCITGSRSIQLSAVAEFLGRSRSALILRPARSTPHQAATRRASKVTRRTSTFSYQILRRRRRDVRIVSPADFQGWLS